MVFLQSQLLWSCLLGIPLIALHFYRHPRLERGQWIMVSTARCLAVLLLLVALARPAVLFEPDDARTVVVVDNSTSMSSQALQDLRATLRKTQSPRRDSYALVLTSQRPHELSLDEWLAAPLEQADGSDLAGALRLAGALVQHDGRGDILLYTDGLATGGDVATVASQLATRGIPVRLESVSCSEDHQIVLRRVSSPGQTRVGARVEFLAEIASNTTTQARVIFEPSGQPSVEQVVLLQAGVQQVRFPWSADQPGLQRFSLRVASDNDSRNDDNALTAAIAVGGPQQIVCLVDENTASTANSLRTLLGSAAEVEPVNIQADDSIAAIDRADLVVLTDIPATDLPSQLQTHLRQRVQIDGLGLLATGGQRALAAGGYADSLIAPVLPVSMTQEIEDHDPSATLVIIIDTSGSMGGPRVSLAKEIARLAIANLNTHDKIGVVEFYGSKRWAAPIQSASNAIAIQRALNRLSSGGGTVILPALEEAFYALKNVRTRTRHVLVLTDGGIETDAFEPLIRKMADTGITVSTVLVGPGRYSTLMGQIAHWGGGRTYTAPDRYTLPEVIIKQPQSARLSTQMTGAFRIEPLQPNELLASIDLKNAPQLNGYNQVNARPAAQTLLTTSQNAPLLVRWRHGAGAVAVWASQLDGPWSQSLAQWPEYPRLISNLVRSLVRPSKDTGLDIQTIVRPGGLELDIRMQRWDAGHSATSPIVVRVERAASILFEDVVYPIQPGRWNLWVPDLLPGIVRVLANTQDNNLTGITAVAIPPEREWQTLNLHAQWPTELDAIHALAQQRASVLAANPANEPLELWPHCVVIALVLTLLHVLLRRWPMQRHIQSASVVALLVAAAWLPTETRAQQTASGDTATVDASTVLEAERAGDVDRALKTITDLLHSGIDPEQQFALQVRSALLLYERGDRDAARAALKSAAAVRDDQATLEYCAHLAALAGDAEFAVEHWPAMTSFERAMFHGLWNLRQEQPQQAAESFAAADKLAQRARDVRLARAYQIVAARASNRLETLAQTWLASPLSNETEIELLAGLLREFGRGEDALKLLRDVQANSSTDNTAKLQQTILGFLIETQREQEAETLYRELLSQDPGNVNLYHGLAHLLLLQERRADARQIFSDAINASLQPATILSLGEAARDLGLHEAARSAAARTRQVDAQAALDSFIFEARVEQTRGNLDTALAIVRQAADTPQTSPVALKRLANVLEELGDSHTALTILKSIYEQTGAEDILLRYAWLLESSGQLENAYTLWLALWRQTESPARLRQSQERLLDLAARTNRLADLAIEIEERLDTGVARERELELLVELYTRVNDTVSAAEILHQFGRQTGNQIEPMKRLVRVYLSGEQFERCDALLQRLIKQDPENAADYLQQSAMLAIERQHTADLQARLSSIRALGSEAQADEISASLLSMAGLHDESVATYERLLETYPDRIEAWLSWGNAMRDAGRRPSALNKFQQLLDQADADDLFAVAVDGLLNLEAPQPILRYAVRRVYGRIAADPQHILLYRLAADLLEAAGDLDAMHLILEQTVLIAGDQRAQILRELMDSAQANGLPVEAVAYARLLVMIVDVLPPQAWLDMGKLLLDQSHVSEAASAFERAAGEGDHTAIYQDIARIYEEAGQLTAADHILRELLILTPDDIDVLLRAATLAERQGQAERALRQYSRAVQLQLRHLPSTIEGERPPEADVSKVSTRRNRNVDLVSRTLDRGIRGALRCMSDAQPANTRLLGLPERIQAELQHLRASELLANEMAAHPRLARTVNCLRHLAFANHLPESADEVDRAILAAFPHDTKVWNNAVGDRLTWRLIGSARGIANLRPDIDWPSDLLAAAYADEHIDNEHVLAAVAGNTRKELDLAARALLTGSDDLLHKVLQQMEPTHDGWNAVATNAISLAVLLEEDTLVLRWADTWLTDVLRQGATQDISGEISDWVKAVWAHIDNSQRITFAHRIGQLVQAQNGRASAKITRIYSRLADALEMPLFESIESLQEVSQTASADDVVWMMRRLDTNERQAYLRNLLNNGTTSPTRSIIQNWVGSLIPTDMLDETLTGMLMRNYRLATGRQTDTKGLYTNLCQGGWIEHARQTLPPAIKQLLSNMATVLLQEYEATAAGNVVAARVLFGLGDWDAGLECGQEALRLIRSQPILRYEDVRMLDDLVAALPHDALALLTPKRLDDDASGTEYFVQAMLLEALDRTDACLAALRVAYEKSPENRSINRRLISRFERAGHLSALAYLLSKHLSRSTIIESYEWRTLANLELALYRPTEAMAAAQHDASPLGPVRVLKTAMFVGDAEYAWTTLQQFAATGRNAERRWDPSWPADPSADGLTGWLETQQTSYATRSSMFRALAQLPTAETAYADWLRAARPNQRNVPGLTAGLVDAWQHQGVITEKFNAIIQHANNHTATAHDNWTLLHLLSALPEPVASSSVMSHLLASVDLHNRDQLHLLVNWHGLPAETQIDVLIWMIAMDGQFGYSSARLDDRVANMKRLIALLPTSERTEISQRLVRSLTPSPQDRLSDSILPNKLEMLLAWSPSHAADELEQCRQIIETHAEIQNYPQTSAVFARDAADKQDWQRYRQYVEVALRLNPSRRDTRLVIDVRAVLPDHAGSTLEQCVTTIGQRLTSLFEQGRLRHDTLVRTMSLLADACREREAIKLAQSIRGQLETWRAAPGEHWLWEADLCRRLGDTAAAHQIEWTLAGQALLPMARVARLLAEADQFGESRDTDQLVTRLTDMTDHPAVLIRARALAQREQHLEAYQAYETRLKQWSTAAQRRLDVPNRHQD